MAHTIVQGKKALSIHYCTAVEFFCYFYQFAYTIPIMSKRKIQNRERLTREQWLTRSLDILSEEGPGELRIDTIAAKMKVTRGSFYWHFKNRADYIKNLAEYWLWSSTDEVIDTVNGMDADPKTKLTTLITHVIRENLAGYDIAAQMLMHKEPQIAPIITEAFVHRASCIQSLFKEMGYQGQDLATRTHLFVGFFSLDAIIKDQSTKKKRLHQALKMLDFLTIQ